MQELTDEELLQEAKKMKTNKVYDAVIVGFLIGVSIYSIIKNGFGLLTFLPLLYLPVAKKNTTKRNTLEQLINERGLKR